MLISYCIPCKNRTYDLKESLPTVFASAALSPPIEVVILNYGSTDDLDDYVKSLVPPEGVTLTYKVYDKNPFFHMAHARNLVLLAASGEYIINAQADLLMTPRYFSEIRRLLTETGAVWMRPPERSGVLVVKKQEFIDSGGVDERFEFYGPEDKDLANRLKRRGGKFSPYPASLFGIIFTPDREKIKNYRLQISKRQMHLRQVGFLRENDANNQLVANEGIEWGKWT